MSLFTDYKKERENKEAIEVDGGFCTYIINGELVYIEDIFVAKDKRRSGLAFLMADQVVTLAKEHGCKRLLGTIDPSTIGAPESLKLLMAYGLKPCRVQNGPPLWWFEKEI